MPPGWGGAEVTRGRKPYVTDHALLRYIERVAGVDVQKHREAVEAKVAKAVEMEACALVHEGFRYVIKDLSVVTVRAAASDPRVLRRESREADE